MATAPSQRSLDKQAAADLLVQPSYPTKLELMQASSFSHIVSLQSEDIRQSILMELQADKPANGYTADAAAQIAENVSKDRTDEWPFLRTYKENVGHMVARTELSEQSTRLMEILKENPIDSFEKPSPSLMDYGQTLLAVELNLRPNISETEKLPSLLRGIETAAHHNAYDQYHYGFDDTKEPAANYTDIALDAKERTRPFIEAVYNDPAINRNINSDKRSYFNMDTGPDGLLLDSTVASKIIPDGVSERDQRVVIAAINTLPYSAQQEAAESLKLSMDFGMDFEVDNVKENLTHLMELRDSSYPNVAADDLSQRELFTEAFDRASQLDPAPMPVNTNRLSPQAEAVLALTTDSNLSETSSFLMSSLLRGDFQDIEANLTDNATASKNLPVLLQHVNNRAMETLDFIPAGPQADAQINTINEQMAELTTKAYQSHAANPDLSRTTSNKLYSSDISELDPNHPNSKDYFHPDASADTNRAITDGLKALSAPEQQVALYGLKSTAQVGIPDFNQKHLITALLADFDRNHAEFGITKQTPAESRFNENFEASLVQAANPNVSLLNEVTNDLGNNQANDMLASINKDYIALSTSAQVGNTPASQLVSDSRAFFAKANDFGGVVSDIASKSTGDDATHKNLSETLKGVGAFVDEAAHIAQFVTHDTDNMLDVRSESRMAMMGMDNHQKSLDGIMLGLNTPSPVVDVLQPIDKSAYNVLSPIEKDLRNGYLNNVLAGINKDFEDLSIKSQTYKTPDVLLVSKGIEFLDTATSFGRSINFAAAQDNIADDKEHQQDLKDTLKGLSAYVDDAAHIVNHASHNKSDMADVLNRTKEAQLTMDSHKVILDATIADHEKSHPSPDMPVSNTDNAPAPRR